MQIHKRVENLILLSCEGFGGCLSIAARDVLDNVSNIAFQEVNSVLEKPFSGIKIVQPLVEDDIDRGSRRVERFPEVPDTLRFDLVAVVRC